MFSRLIKIANFLDQSGRGEDADYLDFIIKKLSYEMDSDLAEEIAEIPDEEEQEMIELLSKKFESLMNRD